jgi:sulfatase modifying factor 1
MLECTRPITTILAALLLGGCGHIELGSRKLQGDARLDGGTATSAPAGGTLPEDSIGGSTPPASGLGPPASAGDGGPTGGSPDDTADSGPGPAAPDPGALPPSPDALLPADPTPPSCRGTTELCGPDSDSCCLALPVAGATLALPIEAGGTRSTVGVSSYYLDKFEVTVGRFRVFLRAYDAWRAAGHPRQDEGSHPRVAGSGWQASYDAFLPTSGIEFDDRVRNCGNIPLSTLDLPNTTSRLPINCVTWAEAAAFCAWDEARLPTYPEWYAAAAGGELDRIYPWGDEPTPSRVYASYGCTLGLERPECTAAYVLPVGSHPSGAGIYQHHDLAGSMSEWSLSGSLDEFAAGCTDCGGVSTDALRFWKSGSWVDDPAKLENIYLVVAEHTIRQPFLGLRCARDAP